MTLEVVHQHKILALESLASNLWFQFLEHVSGALIVVVVI